MKWRVTIKLFNIKLFNLLRVLGINTATPQAALEMLFYFGERRAGINGLAHWVCVEVNR